MTPFLEPFDLLDPKCDPVNAPVALRHLRAFNVRLKHDDERPVGYVVENTTLEPDERPWSAFRYRQKDGHSLPLPGYHLTQEEALAALLATIGGNP